MKENKILNILKTKSENELREDLVFLVNNFSTVKDYFDLKYNKQSKKEIIQK